MRAIGAGAAARVAETPQSAHSKSAHRSVQGFELMAKDKIDASADDRRHDPRFVVNLPAHVTIRGDRVLCKLIDISLHGALVETAGPVHVGDKVSLDLPNIGPTIATVLRITPTHMAMVFPGAVVISSLIPKD
jgi:hypothetical protein